MIFHSYFANIDKLKALKYPSPIEETETLAIV